MVHPDRRQFATMADAVCSALDDECADQASGRARCVRLYDDAGTLTSHSFAELAREGLRWAHWFRRAGVRRNEVVFLGLPMGIDYIGALLGCIVLGIVPCTVPFGTDPQSSNGALNTTLGAFRTIAPRLYVTTREAIAELERLGGIPAAALVHVSEAERTGMLERARLPALLPTDLHHLQLTSGSTAAPKAAMLTHEAVTNNIDAVGEAMQGSSLQTDVGCCWLPMFHDMGLMQLLLAIYQRGELVLQSSGSFLRNPMRWLERISAHRVTMAAAPAFAFTYCVRRYRRDVAARLDLSRWRFAGVGAERVEHRVLREFHACYAPHGFAAEAFLNCYGMAEAGFAVAMPIRSYSASDDAEPVPSVGMPVAGMQIQVRDAQGCEVQEGEHGELFMRGASLMSGYYGDPDSTARSFDDEWMRTGDLGYCRDGELYILGRIKELVILGGRNYHPQEFEQCVAADPDVGMHRAVAIGVYREQTSTESLVVLVEPRVVRNLAALRKSLQARLRAEFGFSAREIIFLQSGAIPRTTSHKVRRHRCWELYQSGHLVAIPERQPEAERARDPAANAPLSKFQQYAETARQ